MLSPRGACGVQDLKTISYRVKDASGQVRRKKKVAATRWGLNSWVKTLPRPWIVAMEATIFTGWIDFDSGHHFFQLKVRPTHFLAYIWRPSFQGFWLSGVG